ncbi:uncharacterized protein LOC105187756 [Harpegnathos saltator]|uniref:Chitin-binding type-2 domain-containing protein n=1 Tax=Harpegnathos saltator TaxID=610380 RepID=E2BXU9_HARSA|nr:uncharacterized protein LOC105187756 [Harpegnathos saltator]EFN79506.1 hypothetical protein EAI_12463 [Harpegnathos saltator]
MVFKLGLVLTFAFASCMAHEGYPNARPSEQLSYEQGYNHQDPHDQLGGDEISGVAGKDYPVFREVPQTRFECEQQQYPGYYADPEAECQAFHICQRGGRKDSFLCPNGTLFNQARLVCEWWYNVDCSRAPSFYSINEVVAKAMEEADRLIRLAAEEKLSRGYQRESNVNSGYWNQHNQQDVKQGWNDIPARHNPMSNFAKDLPYDALTTSTSPVYGAPEFAAKSLPDANNHGNSYPPEQNYVITDAKFGKQSTRNNNFAEPANVYLPA